MNESKPSIALAPAQLPDGAFARISIALFLAGFATFSLIYCTQPLLPEFSADFNVDPATSSLALSLTTFCLAISILCAGALSETTGRRGLMFASICIAAILNLAASVATNWTMLLALRALEGLALGGVPAVAMAYLAEEIPPARLGLTMGLYISGTALGGMLGRVAIGALTEFSSWRIALRTISVVDLVVAIVFVFLLPASRNFARRPGLTLRLHLDAWRGHLRHSELPWLFLTGFLTMGAFVSIYNYAGYRLMAPPYDLNQMQIGLIFLAYLFGAAASSAAGALADRLGRAPVLIAAALITIAGLAITLLQPLAAVIIGIVVITIGFFMAHSVASGWVGRVAHGAKSHAASLYLLAYYVGASVLGSFAGWFWREGGWAALVVFSGTATLIVLAVAYALGRRRFHGLGQSA